MKTTLHILTLVLLSTLVSCGQPNGKIENTVITADTLFSALDRKDQELMAKRKEIEEQENIDSIVLDKVLKDALTISTQNISKDKFHKEYEVTPGSEYTVKVNISLDNHFTKLNSHLIIRRHGPNTVYIDIYYKNDNNFVKVLSHEQWTMEYMNDTIRDINGDGFNDFVVNWYGMNGCCLKAFSNVYILRLDKKTFSNNLEFINPTFSPIEKVIRGVCYGHPGETEIYKYKWNGEALDTLEYVSYEKSKSGKKTGKILITKNRPYDKNEIIIKRLNSIPKEYKNIDGFDWFTGTVYK